MSSNPYAPPRSADGSVHRLQHWKTKWVFATIVVFGMAAPLVGVRGSWITLAMIAVALSWIKKTWEFLPPRHRGATEPWVAAAIHCVPVINVVWMVIFNRRLAQVLNDTLRPYSRKSVSPILAVASAMGPAVVTVVLLLLLSASTESSTATRFAISSSAFVGRALYLVWMWRVDACCEEILALRDRAAEEAREPESVRPKKKKKKRRFVEPETAPVEG